MSEIPSGTITFLFTDIEGNLQMWERDHEWMQIASARQEVIIRQVVAEHGGYAYKMVGGSFQVAFETAPAALETALEAQRKLDVEPWGETSLKDTVGKLKTADISIQTATASARRL
jgi:class 3 adenylate cyclase